MKKPSSPRHLFGLWSRVFHGDVGIRRALRRCQQDAHRPSWRSSPRFPSLLLQCGFFDGNIRFFCRIGSKPFLWWILKTWERARCRNVIETLWISRVRFGALQLFPARTCHALLPLGPSMESPCPTPPAPKNYIIRNSATSSHHPAISRCRERSGTGRFHTRSKRFNTSR